MSRQHTFVEVLVFSFFLSVFASERIENPESGTWIDLQNQFMELSRRVQELESRDRVQQEEINSLKSEILIYKRRTTTLEKALDNCETHQPETGEINEDDANVKQATNTIVSQVINGNKDVHRIRQVQNEVPVAFFATLNKHADQTGVGQNIIFDNVITNIGSAYSSTLGAFVAPVSGTYVFSASLMALVSQTEHYWFSKNSQTISKMYVRSDESPYGTASVTAVLQLNVGDNVEIKTGDAGGSAHGSSYSTFAGFLLQQGDSSSIVGK